LNRQIILLSGEPKSTQHIYGLACRGRFPQRYMTPAGKALKEQYRWEAKAQWKGKPLTGDVRADITLNFRPQRAADWDNFPKLSCDPLTGSAISG
jgi:Holliday junction resolvase RusA-like endonuclease